MGSSGGCNAQSIDASVGGLVWVRRRNGSWWPGRIVGLEELSDSCLVSPKSGTPVKLLGRDDASVDWYNLEKSKRVKAFRCGEYDECIEKASAANYSKKAVKYARREDAILHALEIESEFLLKDRPDFCSRTESKHGELHGGWARASPTLSHSSKENEDLAEEMSILGDTSNSTQELSQSGLSFEETNQISPSKVQGKRRRTPNDSEDDGTEGIKRMRGLEDLGIGIVTPRKPQAGGDLDIAHQDTTSPCGLNTLNSLSVGRKKSQVAKVHEFFKRRNRRRPLMKVLESTAMVSVPVMCDELASPYRSSLFGVSENMEANNFKSSAVVNNSSESTGISCENGVLFNATEVGYNASHFNCKIKENEISSAEILPENAFSDTLFDVPFIGEEKHSAGFPLPYSLCSSGKPQAGDVKRQSSHSSQEETISLKAEGPIENGSTSSAAAHIDNTSSNIDKGTSKWKLKGKRKSRLSSKSRKRDSRKFVDKPHVEHRNEFSLGSVCREPCIRGLRDGLEFLPDCSLSPRKLLPYRHSRYAVHPKYRSLDFAIQNHCADSLLYDVDVKVEPSYRPLHVPLVSLVSKLNGKAIVGHPLTVEALADGCSLPFSNSGLNDRGMPNWEGAKTGCAAKPNANMRKIPTKNASTQTRRSCRDLPKLRKCGFMSKKIRKLSSLTRSQMQSKEERERVVEKPKGGPVTACIPLKVVFSRLNEAVNVSTR